MPENNLRYLVATSSSLIGVDPNIHVMIGPRQGGIRPIREGRLFGADNDAFHNRFDLELFARHLDRLEPYIDRNCSAGVWVEAGVG